MTAATIIHHGAADGVVGLIRVYVSNSGRLCVCVCLLSVCTPINQNLSLVPNGDRLLSKET